MKEEIIPYGRTLKPYARQLRKNMTEHEAILWQTIRKKQIQNVQFYRQKIIGTFILDFYSREPKLAIELDGNQHLTSAHIAKDNNRDEYLKTIGILVLRFSNLEISNQLESVLSKISRTITQLK
jgi:very-short-patch-repair endonuclease